MILLRLISWPYFRTHVLRTVLTSFGIALGVSVFVGMHTANRSVLSEFARTIDRIAGKTELQVTAGETGFGEDVLERVQAASTVRVAVPVVEAIVDSNIRGQGNLLVLGVDMTGDRSLRDYDVDSDAAGLDDPLVFLAQPDSLILTREFAERNGIAVGSRLPLGTVDGDRSFTVRGIIKSSGLATAFGGNLAIMDIYAAQKMFGRGAVFDRIDVAVKAGRTLAECQRELAALLGPGFDVQAPASRGQQFEAMLAGYSIVVTVSSAFALFIGMFIIYHSFAIAVSERRREIGILRALGATRTQIRMLFLGESAVIGLVGSVGGLALGTIVARMAAASVSAVLADVYFVPQQPAELTMNPLLLALALAAGVATSLAAAAIPARSAARIDPVRALQKGKYQLLGAGESRIRAIVAGGLGLLSALCLTATTSRPVFYAGYALAIMVVPLLLGPLFVVALTRALRPVLRRLRPIEGALAADSLIRSPRRTSACVSALMLSLALIVAFAGMARSSYESIVDWMNATFNSDLFVSPTPGFDIQTTRFPASMAPEIAALPGVARVQMFRIGRITFRGTPVSIVAIEMASVADTTKRQPVAGRADEMYRSAAAGEGLIVSDNLAQLQHLTLGEVIEIPAPYGVMRLPIAGIVVDYTDQQGTILVDRAVFIRYWRDDSVRDFRVHVAPGASVADVRQRILDRYAGERRVFVLTNPELKDYIVKVANQWFGLTTAQIAVAVFVAILGIVNTLTVSITDRRRELGVLRAVGARHGQIRRTIWIEALSVAVLGLVLGCALGALNLYYTLEIVRADIAGMRLDYLFPLNTVFVVVPIILGAAFLAALWPAESAVRGSLVEALEYE